MAVQMASGQLWNDRDTFISANRFRFDRNEEEKTTFTTFLNALKGRVDEGGG
jgi:hypothetical protein